MDDPTPIVDAPSKPPRRFRKLRIGVSVAFGVLAVAWLVLSWRAKYVICDFRIKNYKCEIFHWPSEDGRQSAVSFSIYDPWSRRPIYSGYPATRQSTLSDLLDWAGIRFFSWPNLDGYAASLPDPYLIAASATLITALIWVPRSFRFSVRTLLFATTLVAVVLGLVCYAVS